MRVAVDGIYFGLLRKVSLEQLADVAVTVGADGVNFPLDPSLIDISDEAAVNRAVSVLRERGIDAVSLGIGKQLSATPGGEEEFRAYISKAAAAAKRFQAKVLDCWPRLPEGITKQEGQRVLASNIEALTALMEYSDTVLSFEFEPDTALERYEESLAFVSRFSPLVRLTVDTYHVNRAGDSLVSAAHALRDRIGIVHISGSDRGEPGSPTDLCDHEGLIRTVREQGYEGDLVLQYAPPADPEESLKRAVAFCRRLIERTA